MEHVACRRACCSFLDFPLTNVCGRLNEPDSQPERLALDLLATASALSDDTQRTTVIVMFR